jgi:glycosyltransferase involved in cell wall biosynthesis
MRFSGLISLDLVRWLWRHADGFDLAHLHAARDLVPLSAGLLLRRAGVPYVTQTHGMVEADDRLRAKVFDRLLTLRVLRHASTRFVLTDDESAALGQLLGTRATVTALPNGVTIGSASRRPTEPLDVLFLARLHKRKRVMDFAQAAAALIRDGVQDVRFSVVGPDDGDLKPLLAFIESTPAVQGRLFYEGPVPHDDALDRISRAGIFVLPSVDEPFPMTLLEALALGTPSICTSSCGVAEDLRQDDAAIVIEPGPRALQAALHTLIADPEKRRQLSDSAQRTARSRYSMQSVGARLLTIYKSGV